MNRNAATVAHGGRIHKIAPDAALVLEIEEELGPVALLSRRLEGEGWSAAELVTLMQIVLQHAGITADYLALGNGMIRDGLKKHAADLGHVLRLAMEGDR